MISPIPNQIPRGDNLTRAVSEHQPYAGSQDIEAQIQRGFDASNDRQASRTSHADFMAELKSEIMVRINAR